MFKGLSRHIRSGQTDWFGFVNNQAAAATVPGPITVNMTDRAGRSFFHRRSEPGVRGSHMLGVELYLGDERATISARFVERHSDGTSCVRTISQTVFERRRIYFPSRCKNAAIRPRSVRVACGDGNFRLHHMHWQDWHAKATTGSGTATYDDCVPFCGGGETHSTHVEVKLSRPRDCKRIGRYMYTRLHYRLADPPRSGSRSFSCDRYPADHKEPSTQPGKPTGPTLDPLGEQPAEASVFTTSGPSSASGADATIDNDAKTAWSTKTGDRGIMVTPNPGTYKAIRVVTETPGWGLEIYYSNVDSPSSRDDWIFKYSTNAEPSEKFKVPDAKHYWVLVADPAGTARINEIQVFP
ncbi:MAG: hypothetical protein ACJ760_12460 [Thermoleophilaceae bacterium]